MINLAFTVAWQSTMWLALGLLASRVWRRRAARAHLLLILATVAAVISPVMTATVRQMNWGVLPATATADVESAPPAATVPPPTPIAEEAQLPIEQSAPPIEPIAMTPDVPADTAPVAAPAEPTAMPAADSPPVPAPSTRWGEYLPAAIAGCWIVASCVLAIRLAISLVRGSQIATNAGHEVSPQLSAALNDAAAALGTRSIPSLRVSRHARCPMIWCWGSHAVLLLPESASESNGVNWRSVFCHELAHLVRRDHWSALWAELLVIALPWLPLAWLARRRLAYLREQACDDWVLAVGGTATDYAQSLLQLVPQRSPAYALAAVSSRASLKRRLEHVLKGVRVAPNVGRRWVAAVGLVSLAGIAGVALAQQRSQAPPSEERRTASAQQSPAAAASPGPAASASAMAETPTPSTDKSAPAAKIATSGRPHLLSISGNVVNERGEPIAGAHVAVVAESRHESQGGELSRLANFILAEAGTGSDGTFRMPVIRASSASHFLQKLIGRAEGHAVAWQSFDLDAQSVTKTLRLEKEQPIRGRLVDLQGQPAAHVRMRVQSIMRPRTPDGAEDQNRSVEPAEQWATVFHRDTAAWPAVVVSDDQGRFTVRNVGARQGIVLEVDGDSRFAPQILEINTGIKGGLYDAAADVKPGEAALLALAPSQFIEGVLRFADTGEPAANGRVTVWSMRQKDSHGSVGASAQADAEGHFRINCRQGTHFRLVAYPPDGTPYLACEKTIDAAAGTATVDADIDLPRGVLIRGKIVEAGSKKPVPNASIEYEPQLKRRAKIITGWQGRQISDAAGEFTISVPSGRGHLLVYVPTREYVLKVIGSEELSGTGHFGMRVYANAIQPIDFAADLRTVDLSIVLERGVTVTGRLLRPDGRAADHALLLTRQSLDQGMLKWSAYPDKVYGGKFSIAGCVPGDECPVYFYEPEARLGAALRLRADQSGKPVEVRLQHCGAVKLRIVDRAGKPVAAATVQPLLVMTPGLDLYSAFGRGAPAPTDFLADYGNLFSVDRRDYEWGRPKTDADGRITLPGLVPGATYFIEHPEKGVILSSGVTVPAGETLDLGDIVDEKPRTQRSPQSNGAAAASRPHPLVTAESVKGNSTNEQVTVHGQVLDPQGKPAVGATVSVFYASQAPKPHLRLAATRTDANGRYTLSFPKRRVSADMLLFGNPDVWAQATCIIASQPGFGSDAARCSEFDVTKPLDLKLVEAVPVHGRLFDLEGRPVPGVTVEVQGEFAGTTDDLDRWLGAVRAGLYADTNLAKGIPPFLHGPVTSDADGRFRIDGVGKDRVLRLVFRGETNAYTTLSVVTRDIQPTEQRVWPDMNLSEMRRVVGPTFTFTVAPTRPVIGTVRDSRDHKALSGIRIASDKFAGSQVSGAYRLTTQTDTKGRFRLAGLPKGKGNVIGVFADGQPYFPRSIKVPDPSGAEPIVLDVELDRGIWIAGRVTDLVTHQPQLSRIYYYPLRTNRFATRLSELHRVHLPGGPDTDCRTESDGSFRIVGLPGPAIVAAWCTSGDYRMGTGFDEIKMAQPDADGSFFTCFALGWESPLRRDLTTAVKEINPPEDAQSVACDFALDPGQSIDFTVLDSQGSQTTGYTVEGRRPLRRFEPPRQEPRFRAVGLRDGEKRFVTIHDEKRHIGKAMEIDFGPATPRAMTVRLEPCAEVVGRAVDRDGTPVGGLRLEAEPLPRRGIVRSLPSVRTGADGRFRNDAFLPGIDYAVSLRKSDALPPTPVRERLTIKPGETIDVGDVVVRQSE